MGPKEQRLTSWASLAIAVLTLLLVLHLERDRFQSPFATPVGVEWKCGRLMGGGEVPGVGRAPVQYCDVIALNNMTDKDLENVKLGVLNWANGSEVWVNVGTLKRKEKRELWADQAQLGFPPRPYEINPRDVLVVRCDGYMDKRVPMKELGKETSIEAMEKATNKESGADPDFWPKYWKWAEEKKRKERQKEDAQ